MLCLTVSLILASLLLQRANICLLLTHHDDSGQACSSCASRWSGREGLRGVGVREGAGRKAANHTD